MHSCQLFQSSHCDEAVPDILYLAIGNPVPPLEPFDGLLTTASQRVHSRFRSIVDKSLATSHSVQKGDIEAHDTESDYADFIYSVTHKEILLGSIRLYPRYHRRRVNSMSFKRCRRLALTQGEIIAWIYSGSIQTGCRQ